MDVRIEVIKKNYEERIHEFVNILNREDCLPGCKILDEWRFHLELTLKKSGWLAVYKPLKGVKHLSPGVDFKNEIVLIENVEYHNFEAYVVGTEQCETVTSSSETSSVQTNKIFCVPLEDLYPCINQPDPEVDGIELSNIIDQYRFFRVNLWLPWDEEDDKDDWRELAMEPRMQLLYDMDQGLVSCEVSERVKRLWRQAWAIHSSLQNLEVSIDDDGAPVPIEEHADEEEGLVIRIMQLHHRLDSIKHELDRLQNPLIRNLMVREKQRMLRRSGTSDLPWSRLVWGGGSTQNLAALVSEATMLTGSDQRFKIYPLLPMALEEANSGDYVLLSPGGLNTVTGSAGLEFGGVIKGLGSEMSIVSGCEAGDVMLNISCSASDTSTSDTASSSSKTSCFSISNVALEAYNMEICLLLNTGYAVLENCLINGGGSHDKDDSVGVMVRGGSKLVAKNCVFTGFSSAIIAYDGAEVELINCKIKTCEIGVQLHQGAKLSMDQCLVSDCSSNGIYYKWSSIPQLGDKILTQELLNMLPGLTIKDTEFSSVPLGMQITESEANTSSSNSCM